MSDRRLILIRHAKAVSGDIDDVTRSLAPKGLADAAAIGHWLAEHGIAPSRVVVSPARRALQTWDYAGIDVPDLVVDDRIYGNTTRDLLAVITDTPDDVTTLALVGHNPSMQSLASTLDDGTGPESARDSLNEGLGTSGIAVFTIPGAWDTVAANSGRLEDVAKPRS